MGSPTLHTLRLDLVPLGPALLAAARADRAGLAALLGATVPASWPNPDSAALLPDLARALAEEPHREAWRRLIVDRASRRLIGDLGATDPPEADGCFEIGYGIIPEARDQGYAREAVRAFCTWASSRPPAREVLAETTSENLASAAVLRAVGFRSTSRGHDPAAGPTVRWRLSLPLAT